MNDEKRICPYGCIGGEGSELTVTVRLDADAAKVIDGLSASISETAEAINLTSDAIESLSRETLGLGYEVRVAGEAIAHRLKDVADELSDE